MRFKKFALSIWRDVWPPALGLFSICLFFVLANYVGKFTIWLIRKIDGGEYPQSDFFEIQLTGIVGMGVIFLILILLCEVVAYFMKKWEESVN